MQVKYYQKNSSNNPRWGDCPVALQASCVPDLGLDGKTVQLHSPGAELHSNSGATVMVELVFGEAWQQVAFAHTGLANQNHWEDKRKSRVNGS